MPTQVTRPQEDSFQTWTTEGIPFPIEYSTSVMEELRQTAEQGFQKIPHGGVEVGAILFGKRDGSTIRICEWRPIDCSHAKGPSFVLSDRDLAGLREAISGAAVELPDMEPVGWFHTHTRSEIFLSPDDVAVYNEIFPEPWQVALVMRLRKEQPAVAGFFFREPDGAIQTTGSHREFVVRPDPHAAGRPHRPTSQQGRRDAQRSSSPRQEIPARPLQKGAMRSAAPEPPPRVPVFRAAGPSLDEPVPMVEPANIPTTLEGRPRRSFRRQLFWIVVACALAVVVGLGVRWYSEAGGRRAGVGLRVEDAGQQLVIRWDHSAAAIVEADSGSMVIQDGKETKNLALDTLSVRRGTITYAPEHDDVEVNMTVRKGSVIIAQEFTRYLGRRQPAAPRSNATDADRERMRAEAERLRQALRQETDRTQRLENTLRVLENRTGRKRE